MGFIKVLLGEEPSIFDMLLNYKNTGQIGEYATTYTLSNNNIKGYYKIINNAYLPNNGKLTEIDIIIVHEKGIFVFESKNYSGWIFGSEKQTQWTQSLRGGEKNHFYNPIMQNKTHCRSVATFLDIPESYVISYIVFSSRCKIINVPDNSNKFTIIKRDQLLDCLRKDLDNRIILFSENKVDKYYEKLNYRADQNDELKQYHIDKAKKITNYEICPFCGNKLIIRNGKYGNFYGCSSYPKCKYTKHIKE